MPDTRISLIEQVKSGDLAGWDRFITLYRPLIQYRARQHGVCEDDLEDICQDVYRVLATRLADFVLGERVGSFRKWLASTTRFVCLEHRKKNGLTPRAQGGTEAVIFLNRIQDPNSDKGTETASHPSLNGVSKLGTDDPAPLFPADLITDLVRRAIELVKNEFSANAWKVVELAVIEKRSTAEIASELGLTRSNVLQLKSRFLRRLRLELDGPNTILTVNNTQ